MSETGPIFDAATTSLCGTVAAADRDLWAQGRITRYATVRGKTQAKVTSADEVVTTLLLNPVALLFVQALLHGPWKDPQTGFPESPRIAAAAELPLLAELLPDRAPRRGC